MADFNWVSFTITAANGGESLATGVYSRTIGTPPNQTTESKRFSALIGGTGDDSLTGGDPVEVLNGQFNYNGSDYLDGGGGNDNIFGARGDDQLSGGTGNDLLNGGEGNDNLSGGNGNDRLYGGNGNDTLTGESAGDVLYGEDGNDRLNLSGAGPISAYGGDGDDTFYIDGSGAPSHTLDGGVGNDTLSLTGYFPNLSASAISGIEHLRIAQQNEGFVSTLTAEQINGFEDVGSNTLNQTIGLSLSTSGVIGANFLSTLGGFVVLANGDNEFDVSHTSGNWTVYSANGNDTLTGATGNENLNGGEGNDRLNGGEGNDGLNGAGGVDTASYESGNAVMVDLGISIAQDTLGAGNDVLSGIENLLGSAFNDTLTGSTADNVLKGGNGDDILSGMQGNDLLDGGLGNDTLNGDAGEDTASYESSLGAVTLSLAVAIAQDTGAGIDILSQIENLIGSAFNDVLFGSSSANALFGGGGNDSIDGGSDNDTLNGGSGNDTLTGGAGNDLLDGGDDIDTISYATAGLGQNVNLLLSLAEEIGGQGGNTLLHIESILGSGFNDIFAGDTGANQLDGNNGADSLSGDAGNDTLNGGSGNDTINGGEGNDILSGGDDRDVISGGNDNDIIDGGLGNDILSGDLGNDFIDGNLGNDTLDGGDGNDVLNGGDGNDSISGGNGNETIDGGVGNDTITGGIGNDIVEGGTGRDRMTGGAGNDFYTVDDAGDVIIELASEGAADTVNTALASLTLAANVERLNYTGSSNFVGIGNSGDNRFTGGAGADRFVDVLGGNDTISGGNGSDSMDFRGSSTGVALNFITNVHGGAAAGDVYASVEKYFGSNTANDSMTGGGAGRFIFTGGGGNDTLIGAGNIDNLQGQAGDDSINGLAGIDTIDGGTGNDTLTGGAALDYFVYSAAGFGQDVITDFQDGLDKLKVHSSVGADISAFSITGNGTTSVLLTQLSSPMNTITLQSASAINITGVDFVFY